MNYRKWKMFKDILSNEKLVDVLREGGVAVMPTDTIYGLVGQALNFSTVFRIYEIKKRAPEKPCIVLIGEINELKKFSISLTQEQKKIIENFSTPTSFVLDCPNDLPAQVGKFSYLHRGTKTLAFRLPAIPELCELLLKTGPLVAPSANPEALPPAKNITEAKTYFSDSVDIYVDGGEVNNKHSKLIKFQDDGSVVVLRE